MAAPIAADAKQRGQNLSLLARGERTAASAVSKSSPAIVSLLPSNRAHCSDSDGARSAAKCLVECE